MSILDDLGTYLQTQGLGTLGTTLFKGMIPGEAPGTGSADAVMGLYEIPGQAPLRSLTTPTDRLEQPRIQVVTRGAPFGYQAARQRAQQAFEALDGVSNQTLGSGFYLGIQALGSPVALRVDEWNRPLLSFTVRCLMRSA